MEDISLHILDIAENAITAGASLITVRITEEPDADRFSLVVEDNGRGMPEEFARRALDPFCTTRTTRKVGLGLSLLAQAAEETGGDLSLRSAPGTGTTVTALFRPRHPDMKPLGRISDTLVSLIAANPAIDLFYCHTRCGRTYRFDTREIRMALDGVPLNAGDVLAALRADIAEGIDAILEPCPEQNPGGSKRHDPL